MRPYTFSTPRRFRRGPVCKRWRIRRRILVCWFRSRWSSWRWSRCRIFLHIRRLVRRVVLHMKVPPKQESIGQRPDVEAKREKMLEERTEHIQLPDHNTAPAPTPVHPSHTSDTQTRPAHVAPRPSQDDVAAVDADADDHVQIGERILYYRLPSIQGLQHSLHHLDTAHAAC